jgi:predicted DNA-binding transcriptional regulator YafY
MTRTERLFALAEVLRARRTGITAAALAERFSVTVRTIHRDLTALRLAQFPVGAERGRGGGFALDKSYSLPPINITAREAATLLLLLRYAREMRLLPFLDALELVGDKVRGALSASSQRELERRLAKLSFVGVPALPVDRQVASMVERGLFEQSEISFRYEGRASTYELQGRVESLTFDRGETRVNVVDADGERRPLRMHKMRPKRSR